MNATATQIAIDANTILCRILLILLYSCKELLPPFEALSRGEEGASELGSPRKDVNGSEVCRSAQNPWALVAVGLRLGGIADHAQLFENQTVAL
jgi:hypothetical protein